MDKTMKPLTKEMIDETFVPKLNAGPCMVNLYKLISPELRTAIESGSSIRIIRFPKVSTNTADYIHKKLLQQMIRRYKCSQKVAQRYVSPVELDLGFSIGDETPDWTVDLEGFAWEEEEGMV